MRAEFLVLDSMLPINSRKGLFAIFPSSATLERSSPNAIDPHEMETCRKGMMRLVSTYDITRRAQELIKNAMVAKPCP